MKYLIHIFVVSLIASSSAFAVIGKDDSGDLVEVINDFNSTFSGTNSSVDPNCDEIASASVPEAFGSSPSGTKANGLSRKEKAMLDMIAYAEGTDDSYNFTYNYHKFGGFSDHPRKMVCAGYCSDAAGRYQFLSTTWDGVRKQMGLSSFSPENQDKAALQLIRNRGVEPNSINSKADFERAMKKLSYEWASLPFSPYGQPTHPMSDVWGKYSKAAGI